ncbi:hypothetical protein DRE_03303 [Drechslerella stenobrocha 248]|uniref:Uncharacterized protein n=1 Tax=Drechslerella stenobrocha 248 TaxID=1043628 RepID=W7I688_9PEZI|nr:hypothetical protein DRE_03303 [Drechslerella stenobrocha 248]
MELVSKEEPHNPMEKKMFYSEYSKPQKKVSPPPIKHISGTPYRAKDDKEDLKAKTPRVSTITPDTKKWLYLHLINPQSRTKPIRAGKPDTYLLRFAMTKTPQRLAEMMGKNPAYTRLLCMEVSQDEQMYDIWDVIHPGSRLATLSFRELEWSDNMCISWEHVKNPEEKERCNPAYPWDSQSVSPDDETDD